MEETDWKNESFLTMVEDMEHSWRETMFTAVTVNNQHHSVYSKLITGLTQQLRDKEESAKQREEEIKNFRFLVADINKKLDMAYSENSLLQESKQRELEQLTVKHTKEIENMKNVHKESIQQLTVGAQNTLSDLEAQLESVLNREAEHKNRILNLEAIKEQYEKKLTDWNQVSKEINNELLDVKNRLRSSRSANTKLKEEIELWKTYCEKIKQERQAVKREGELQKKVWDKFIQIENHIKDEQNNRDLIVNKINQVEKNLVEEVKQIKVDMKTKTLESTASQTDILPTDNEDTQSNTQIILKQNQRIEELVESLNRCGPVLEDLRQQNQILREVIKGMKTEREGWLKEKEQIEEEIRVSKLEESVRYLKSSFMSEEKDINIWNTLQDVKKEVTNLKNKNLQKTIKNNETTP